jgi:glutamate formiminotransferase
LDEESGGDFGAQVRLARTRNTLIGRTAFAVAANVELKTQNITIYLQGLTTTFELHLYL